MEKRNKVLSKLTEIYIVYLITIFPLVVDKTGFFEILECKYNAFMIGFIAYAISLLFTFVFFRIKDKVKIFKKPKLSIIQILAIEFLGICIVSTILSPFGMDMDNLIGYGRMEGIFTMCAYILTFLLISLFGKFKKDYIYLFIVSAIAFNSITILQFIGFNPLNMFQEGIGTHNVSFMGTIGNVDFISAYFCIVFIISIFTYIFNNDSLGRKTLSLVAIYMIYIIFQVINVNGGRVAVLLTLLIMCPFVILNSRKISKAIDILAVIMFAYFTNLFINPVYHYDIARVTLDFNISMLPIMFLVLSAVFFVLARAFRKIKFNFETKKNIIIVYVIIAVMIILVLLVIYLYNFDSRFGMIYELHEILHGRLNDEYGTYRVFLWKRTLSMLNENTLIGSGPDTFTLRFMPKFTDDLIAIDQYSINDTSANVYLTLCINVGILGSLTFIAFLVMLFRKAFKKKQLILLSGCLCYALSDIFCLWVVVVTPVYFAALSILYISIFKEEKENER